MYTAQSGTEGDDVLTGSSAQPCVCMYSARPKAMYAIRTPTLSSVLSSGRHAAEQATARPIETRHQTTAAGGQNKRYREEQDREVASKVAKDTHLAKHKLTERVKYII